MKSAILTVFLFFLSIQFINAQGDNCAAPKVINLCPEVKLTGETTAGFTNDRSSWKYGALYSAIPTAGNDVVYEINVPAGTKQILVSITNASAPLYLLWTGNVCNASYYNTSNIAYTTPGNFTIYPSGTGPFYLWIDHNNASNITYDINFGAVTSITTVNYTKGLLRSSWDCITPIFKRDLEVTYNGIHQSFPLVYPSLGTAGIVCSKVYLQNLTGDEGVKKFTFTFGPDMTNLSPVSSSIPGFYNAGNWISTQVGNVITWNFSDAAGKGKGDFTGTPNSCLEYSFCYNVTPISNTKVGTNVVYTWQGDNWGPSRSYTNYDGCSSAPNKFLGSGCTGFPCSVNGSSGGSAASGSGSFDDPFLPVELLAFSAQGKLQGNILKWETAVEKNVNYFEIERSNGNDNFESIAQIKSTGSNSIYNFSDKNAFQKNQYYRLKIVDMDGSYEYSILVNVLGETSSLVKMYPNPAGSILHLESVEEIEETILTDILGKEIKLTGIKTDAFISYDISEFKKGIYYISIRMNNQVNTSKLFIE